MKSANSFLFLKKWKLIFFPQKMEKFFIFSYSDCCSQKQGYTNKQLIKFTTFHSLFLLSLLDCNNKKGKFNCTTMDVQCNDKHDATEHMIFLYFLFNRRLENYWLAFNCCCCYFHTNQQLSVLSLSLSLSYTSLVFVVTFPCVCWMENITSKRTFCEFGIAEIAELFNILTIFTHILWFDNVAENVMFMCFFCKQLRNV